MSQNLLTSLTEFEVTLKPGKVVAAVSIAAPTVRLDNRRARELKKLAKDCTVEIPRALGHSRDERD